MWGRWILAILVVVLIAVSFTYDFGYNVQEEVAVLETDMGTIVIDFLPEVAPKHVARFKELAEQGFYDGVLFHRVIPGFMIQTGDPLTKDPETPRARMGTGGSGQNIPAEFNKTPHVRGTVSAARSRHPDSADSQFFICVGDASWLNGKYTAWGKVVDGMEVADKIVAVERDKRDNPLEPVAIKSIKIMPRDKWKN
ncbi:peptidylprolyl isomerase [bacterium]|nr:peptidylprolyl isomerase [bacterium]